MWGVGVSSPWALRHAYAAFDDWPVNIGFLGRGSSSVEAPLSEALELGGVCGFKVHEDTGAHTRALDTALHVADEYDVQVALHTDGLNESLSVADTSQRDRRTHHSRLPRRGMWRRPRPQRAAARRRCQNVIGSSTNPTLPYGRDAVAEHLDMIMASHGLKPDLPGDVQMASDRIRGATMAGENVLHDLGVIPITSSDAQGMGRAGETVKRTFALAAQNKRTRGHLDGDDDHSDNARVLRYLAKLTINPAIAHGFAHDARLTRGRQGGRHRAVGAAMVRCETQSLVLKSGYPAWGLTGDPNATVDRAEPLVFGRSSVVMAAAAAELSFAIVNGSCDPDALGLRRPTLRVAKNCRGDRLGPHGRQLDRGETVVDAAGEHVTFDGEPLRPSRSNRSA